MAAAGDSARGHGVQTGKAARLCVGPGGRPDSQGRLSRRRDRDQTGKAWRGRGAPRTKSGGPFFCFRTF
jgi:hypothetical protein